MRVTVHHNIDGLAADLRRVATNAKPKFHRVVRANVQDGNELARVFARESAGIHGLNYFKRISGEMTGLLEGEFGPHDGGTPVGAGYRHGAGNQDLPQAADVIGPEFAKEARDAARGLFWGGA